MSVCEFIWEHRTKHAVFSVKTHKIEHQFTTLLLFSTPSLQMFSSASIWDFVVSNFFSISSTLPRPSLCLSPSLSSFTSVPWCRSWGQWEQGRVNQPGGRPCSVSGIACNILAGDEHGADLHDYTASARQPAPHYSPPNAHRLIAGKWVKPHTHKCRHKHLHWDTQAHADTVHQSNAIWQCLQLSSKDAHVCMYCLKACV